MNNVHFALGSVALGLLSLAACSGDDESNSATTSSSSSSTTSSGSGGNTSSGAGGNTSTGSGGNTSTGTGSGTTSGSGGAGGGACNSWLVTYDLTGSVFFIDALIDFTITCKEPYSEDHNMGPGSITLRFPDDNGVPGPGAVSVVSYSLKQNFVTGISAASVTTDLNTTAGPDTCGVGSGQLSGGTIKWSPSELAPYCRDGQVSCKGVLCGTSGSPKEGQPLVFSNDCATPLPLNDFVLSQGIDKLDMTAVVVSKDSNQTTTLALKGTKTESKLDAATPSCACP